ncbi:MULTISPECIES: hypothetical protein [unclassified Treponema]|uniref:hypothetical protein n=1 Tax=unclassified Treponema TaxID=2638727 RepID=UPI0025EE42FB|nr:MULTISPECIES: hypothetical protein [unclassified Treponema]
MTSVADFIKLPKKDFHSSLDLGMRYPSFVTWAGFYVPGFPEDGSPVKIEMRNQVHEYTSMRIATEDDIKKLLFLSISENIADNIIQTNAAIDSKLFQNCKKNCEFFLLLKTKIQKYSDHTKSDAFFSLDTDSADFREKNLQFAKSFLLNENSKELFKGIYFYGKNILNLTENSTELKELIQTVKKNGLKIRVDLSSVDSANDFFRVFEFFEPQVLINADNAANFGEILTFLKKKSIQTVITPETHFKDKKMDFSEKAKKMRSFLEAGIETFLGTQSILLFNKSISQLASELCNTGLFTKEEMLSILKIC